MKVSVKKIALILSLSGAALVAHAGHSSGALEWWKSVCNIVEKTKTTDTNTGATFYTDTYFNGQSRFFEQRDEPYTLYIDNDSYESVIVEENSKVFAWQHWEQGGHYEEWTGQNPDINSIGGLSTIKIVPDDFEGIKIRFIDETGSDEKYCMDSRVWNPEGSASHVYSCEDNPTWQLVGFIPTNAGGEPTVSSIAVRASDGTYINNGSSFYIIGEDGNVHISDNNENLPNNMKVTETGINEFLYSLISEEPDGRKVNRNP
ncbi:MAG: hypothetical protein HRU20_25760 [Pseudomonadales bacterium]|nr:hypothetical protein [Pseudomonadales bacterium]